MTLNEHPKARRDSKKHPSKLRTGDDQTEQLQTFNSSCLNRGEGLPVCTILFVFLSQSLFNLCCCNVSLNQWELRLSRKLLSFSLSLLDRLQSAWAIWDASCHKKEKLSHGHLFGIHEDHLEHGRYGRLGCRLLDH